LETQRDIQRPGNDYKQQVLGATDLVELIGKTVSLTKRGKNYVGLCPFHSEKSPSFNVDSAKQFFHCFGCKASGDAISFVMKRDRIEFKEAMYQLGDIAGLERPAGTGWTKEKAGEKQRLLDAHSVAAAIFQKFLAQPIGATARQYLDGRGFNAQTLQSFQIGFVPEAWDSLLRHPEMRNFPPQLLATAGLLKSREGGNGFYDTFRNRIIFPIRDENGRVIAFGGRVAPGSTDKAKYLNSPETPLFSKNRCLYGLDLARQKIVETRTVAVVEGYADVVMAHQYGATNVVAALGTAIGENHVGILRRFADRIVLLFDADIAGDTAVNRAVELFLTQPVEVAIASMPDGLDPDEYLLKYGSEAFDALLKNAADALTYQWKQLVKSFNQSGNDLTGQQKAVKHYLELLASARGSGPVDPLRWGSALARVSRLTDIPVEELNRQFKKKAGASNKAKPLASLPSNPARTESALAEPIPVRSTELFARDRVERWILAVLLNQPGRWHHVQLTVHPGLFTDPVRKQLAELYWEHQTHEGEPVLNDFLGALVDPEVAQLAVDLVAEFETLGDPDIRLKEAVAYFDQMRATELSSKHLADLRRTSVPGQSGLSSEGKASLELLMAAATRRSGEKRPVDYGA
jgi:DNA primase